MWAPDKPIQEIYTDGYLKMPKYAVDDQRLKAYREVHVRLIDMFFEGGMEGLEFANYYGDNPNPLTKKKLTAIEGKYMHSRFEKIN